MVFKVKGGRYLQESKREGDKVTSLYRGKVGDATVAARPTKLEIAAGDRIRRIDSKIETLYAAGYGDRKIARILYDEDLIGNDAPLGPNVIKTRRERLGTRNRTRAATVPKTDWERVAGERQQTIDELKRSLAQAVQGRERRDAELQKCWERYYSLKYPASVVESGST